MKLLDQVAQIECYFAKCAHVASRAICDRHEDGPGLGLGFAVVEDSCGDRL